MFNRLRKHLILLTLVGLGVRLLCLYLALPIELTGDEVYYTTVAYNIAEGFGHLRIEGMHASWPPANSFFLSLFIDRAVLDERGADLGRIINPMLVGQAILGSVLVPLAMILSRRLFDVRTAVVTGAITALYPTFIAFSHYAWAENLFIVLVTGSLVAATIAQRTLKTAPVVVTGVLFGLATLTRELGLVIAVACVLWWVSTAGVRRKRAAVMGALLLGVTLATIAPWTVRNYRVLRGFVPVSTVGWMAAAEGNMFDPQDWMHPNTELLNSFRAHHGGIRDELERQDYARRTAIELIRKEQPTWILKKFVRTSGQMLSPDSFLFEKISSGTYPSMPMTSVRFLLIAAVLAYVAVAVLSILGIATAPDRRIRLLPCLVVGGVFLVHLVANASSRYRLPLMPLLIPYAGYALLHWSEIRRRLAGKRLIVALVTLLWFFGLCVTYFADDAASLWRHGTYVSARHR